MSALLAHQGGWDEMLLVLVPIAVVVVLLRLAKKRVQRRADQIDDGIRSMSAPNDANRPTKSS